MRLRPARPITDTMGKGRPSAMTALLLSLIAFAVGAVAAMQPPVNAQLAVRSGGLTAALVSFAVGTVFLFILTLVTGNLTTVSLSSAPWWLFTGGLMGAAFVYTGLKLVPILGATALTAAAVAGQLAGGLLIDRLGLFGVTPVPLSATRLLGVALLVTGAVLVLRR